MIFVMEQAFKEIQNLQFIANIRDSYVTLVWDEYFSTVFDDYMNWITKNHAYYTLQQISCCIGIGFLWIKDTHFL